MRKNNKTLVFIAGSVDIVKWINRQNRLLEGETKYISELREELPMTKSGTECQILDEYRNESLTIRNSADVADAALKGVRAIVGEKISHCGHSLWLANETNLLHFHLLRVFDYVFLLQEIFNKERPDYVYCVGEVNTLFKVAAVVAKANNIRLRMDKYNDKKTFISEWIWRYNRVASTYPRFYMIVLYIMAELKAFIAPRNISKKNIRCEMENDSNSVRTVTFLGTDIKQLDVVYALYKYMSNLKGCKCKLLSLCENSVVSWLKDNNVEAEYLPEWTSGKERSVVRRARFRFLQEGINIFSSKEFRSKFQINGVDCWSVSGEYIMRSVLTGAPHLVNTIETAKSYFRAYATDVVVTPGEWNALSRACVIAARDLGSTSVSVQRGDITDFPGWGGPIYSDLMTVNGSAVKEAMISLGVKEDKLVITGDPRMDPWVSNNRYFTLGKSRTDLKIPDNCTLVAVMTNPVNLNEKASHATEYISALLEVGLEHNSIFFVIKLHPSEHDFDFYRRIQKTVGVKNVLIIKEYNTPQLLYDADVVVTTISTTGEEAIFLDKPLIVMNLTNEPDFMPYAGSDASFTIRERVKVKTGLLSVVGDAEVNNKLARGRKDYVNKHMYSNDGMSCSRCSEVIIKLAATAALSREQCY